MFSARVTRRYSTDKRSFLLALMVLTLALNLPPGSYSQAQGSSAYDVFIDPGQLTLYFVNAQSGLSKIIPADGTQHALLDYGVLFQDRNGAARIAYPDGKVDSAAWIDTVKPEGAVNWVISGDRKRIAWGVIQKSGGSLLSDLYVAASVAGTGKKLALHSSSTSGLISVPLAITNDGTSLFYTRQTAPATDAYLLFPVAKDISRVNLTNGSVEELPGEPNCACAAAFSTDGRTFLRLEATSDGAGFKAHVWNLGTKIDSTIAAPNLTHTQAGHLILSNDNRLAVYTSARGRIPTRANPERYVIVLVDLSNSTQRILTDAIPDHLLPLAFTANNRAVILVDPDKGGTYKLSLVATDSNTYNPIIADSPLSYLGRITDAR